MSWAHTFWLRTLQAAALSLLLATSARADGDHSLHSRPRLELPLLSVGVAAWLTSELLKPRLAPAQCRLCGQNRLDGRVQQALRWSRFESAHHASDALLFAVVPVSAYGGALAMALGHGTARSALTDLLVISEAWVLTSALTQLTKFVVGRERPFVHTQRLEGRDFVASPDDHLSFFSGHTSSTFALAVATATTASLRGYREAKLAWALGLTRAALTGYLRIAADRHYLSDVLTGALVGAGVGVLVPWLHARDSGRERTRESAPPRTLSLTWML